ncbi:hypothetical protein [Herbidospora sp. RD11066]
MELSASSAFDEVRRVEETVRKTRRAYAKVFLSMGVAAGPFWWAVLLGPAWAYAVASVVWLALMVWLFVIPARSGVRGMIRTPANTWSGIGLLSTVAFIAPAFVATGLKIAGVESANWLVTALCVVCGLPTIYLSLRMRSGR